MLRFKQRRSPCLLAVIKIELPKAGACYYAAQILGHYSSPAINNQAREHLAVNIGAYISAQSLAGQVAAHVLSRSVAMGTKHSNSARKLILKILFKYPIP